MTAAEHIERQIAVIVVVAVEEAPFLVAAWRGMDADCHRARGIVAIRLPETKPWRVLGAAGLAVELALQGSPSHLAARVMLLTFRPFRLGHKVQIVGSTGTVRELSPFWTELMTEDKV
jgi:hypothetical protein